MFQNNRVGKFRYQFLITPACEISIVGQELLIGHPSVHHIGRSQIRLTCKNINYSLCSIRLEFLMLKL